MPLAKVIPIVNGLVHTVLADPPNPLVQVNGIFTDYCNESLSDDLKS